jgi:agmatinase
MEVRGPEVAFLGAKVEVKKPDAIILGVPLDATESFRPGTDKAPNRLRVVSDSLESYCPVLQADLEDLNLLDQGDLDFTGLSLEKSLNLIKEAANELIAHNCLMLYIGGEHTITWPLTQTYFNKFPDLTLVHLDAHLDMRDSYEGEKLCHATVMRRVAESLPQLNVVSLGVRSGSREDYQFAQKTKNVAFSNKLSLPSSQLSNFEKKPVYLSLDIDVLDPAQAPGTGNPEPGGFSYKEMFSFLKSIRNLNVVAVDIVEVSPPHDVSDITSIVAAKLIREALLLFVKR